MTKGERTRQRLLEAAIRRFAADGYRRTSVSLTPAATYAYFPSKDALFRAAVDEDAAALIEQATPPENSEDSPTDASGTLAERWLAVPAALQAALDQHPLAKRVLGAQEPEVLPQLLELPSLAELRKRLASDFRAAQRDGLARRDIDADQLAMGLETIVLALLMAGVHVPPGLDRTVGIMTVLDAATSLPDDA